MRYQYTSVVVAAALWVSTGVCAAKCVTLTPDDFEKTEKKMSWIDPRTQDLREIDAYRIKPLVLSNNGISMTKGMDSVGVSPSGKITSVTLDELASNPNKGWCDYTVRTTDMYINNKDVGNKDEGVADIETWDTHQSLPHDANLSS